MYLSEEAGGQMPLGSLRRLIHPQEERGPSILLTSFFVYWTYIFIKLYPQEYATFLTDDYEKCHTSSHE